MRLFRFLLTLLSIGVALLLVASQTVMYFSPELWRGFSVLGMGFMIFWSINFAFWLYFLIHRRKRQWIPMLAWVATLPGLSYSVAFPHPFSSTPAETTAFAPSFRLLTYNTMMMGELKKNSLLLDDITARDADVVCLQEFCWSTNPRHLTREDILSDLTFLYPYYHINTGSRPSHNSFGVAIFSKYPIVSTHDFDFGPRTFNGALAARIALPSADTIAVVCCHLESNHLNRQERNDINTHFTEKSTWLSPLQKISESARVRYAQADSVARYASQSPVPTVVCGDFNDTPVSTTYNHIRTAASLDDAFLSSGFGLGFTFFDHLIRLRIDYILPSSQAFSASSPHVGKTTFSDHRPLECTLTLRKQQQ